MKKNFPFYKSYEKGKKVNHTEKVLKKLNSRDKEILNEFLLHCSVNSKGVKRADSRKRVMIQFRDFLEKQFEEIEDKDFFHFAEAINRSERTPHGRNDVKETIKRFGVWFGEKNKKDFPNLKIIKYEMIQGSNKIKSHLDLLTELELDKLIRITPNLMYKTLICLLWESAGRPEEILKLRWSDIDFKNENIKLHSSKTKRLRIIPVDLTINHLERLKEESEVDEDNFIFLSHLKKPLTNAGLNSMLKEIGKKAGINKYISGYTFRHTRLTSLIKTLSPKSYEMFAGHSLQMGMKTYAHLSVDDLTKEMKKKVFGIKQLTTSKQHELETEINRLKKGLLLNSKMLRLQLESEKIKTPEQRYNHLLKMEKVVIELENLK